MAAADQQISSDRYRELFGAVPSAVSVVTTTTGTELHGTTVSAFGPLSLEPPLVQVCLDLQSELLAEIGESRRFLINVLAHDQEQLAQRFARKGPDDFSGIAWAPVRGLPRLDGCHGWLVANVERTVEVGDHTIVVGLATDSGISARIPLLYHERTFHVISPLADGRAD